MMTMDRKELKMVDLQEVQVLEGSLIYLQGEENHLGPEKARQNS